ncbi:chorismate mutase [Kangiella shandongensis]|uniref:chorismate mutase n=1 Tax=Kangiella shandongensis TaxID=2763258 RepID=UPI001CBAADC4|nr:chorismate mutase [Kangiella shandongensis]
MQALEAIRQQIDKLDLELLEVLRKRAIEIDKLNQIKQAAKQQAYDAKREHDILNRIQSDNKSLYNTAEICSIYKSIFKASIILQHRLRQPTED